MFFTPSLLPNWASLQTLGISALQELSWRCPQHFQKLVCIPYLSCHLPLPHKWNGSTGLYVLSWHETCCPWPGLLHPGEELFNWYYLIPGPQGFHQFQPDPRTMGNMIRSLCCLGQAGGWLMPPMLRWWCTHHDNRINYDCRYILNSACLGAVTVAAQQMWKYWNMFCFNILYASSY